MPRVTRGTLASKKDEEKTEQAKPAQSGGRGKRGAKNTEPVEEPVPIGEGRHAKAKGNSRTSSRGRGKEEDEPEEKVIENETAPSKRGGRGKKNEKEEIVKRGTRGGRGKKEEEEEEKEDEEEEVVPVRRGRGGKAKTEDESPPAKRPARGGRGKVEEEHVEEDSPPKRGATAAKGRGKTGRGRGKQTSEEIGEEEVQEEEEKVEQEVTPKGRQRRGAGKAAVPATPPSGRGRRSGGRGKKEAEEETHDDAADMETEAKDCEQAKEDEVVAADESVAKEERGTKESVAEGAEEMETNEPEEKVDEIQAETAVNEKMEEEEGSSRKRRLDEDKEESASSKKVRLSDSAQVEAEGRGDLDDYVLINKEDVPAADSQEVEDSLPPPVDDKSKGTSDNIVDEENKTEGVIPVPADKAASIVVPLTEAELTKQYNPTFSDRDENSSTMVEVGSEVASEIGSISRNLDMSEVTSMEATNDADQPGMEDTNLSTASSESAVETNLPQPPSSAAVVELPQDKQEDAPAAAKQAVSSDIVSSIPLPSVPTPAPEPAIPAVHLNSIPLPPDVNNSSFQTSTVPHQPSAPPSAPAPLVPTQRPSAQNGNCQPVDPVPQSTPLLTSTPAKKPVVLDSSYIPSSPSITKRKFISNPSFPIELMDPAFCFSVVSYNILADCHLRRYDFSYTESQYLEQSYRHSLMMKELDYLDGDIVCLQEVGPAYYNDVLLPAMTSRGYQAMFMKRTKDWYDEGSATFVKMSKFEVLSHQGLSLKDLAYEEIEAAGLTGDVARAAKKYLDRPEVVLVCKLLSKKTGKHLTVGNVHLAFTPKSPDVSCIQVASAVKELVSKAGSDLNPYIICGDFNSETTSPAYQLAKDGYLSDEHIRNLQSIQSMDNTEGPSRSIIHFLWKAFQHTSSNMKSAYEVSTGREPEVTSLNNLLSACLDYVFFSSSTLYTVGALEVLDPKVVYATGGLPTKDVPSDHISVKAVFRLK